MPGLPGLGMPDHEPQGQGDEAAPCELDEGRVHDAAQERIESHDRARNQTGRPALGQARPQQIPGEPRRGQAAEREKIEKRRQRRHERPGRGGHQGQQRVAGGNGLTDNGWKRQQVRRQVPGVAPGERKAGAPESPQVHPEIGRVGRRGGAASGAQRRPQARQRQRAIEQEHQRAARETAPKPGRCHKRLAVFHGISLAGDGPAPP